MIQLVTRLSTGTRSVLMVLYFHFNQLLFSFINLLLISQPSYLPPFNPSLYPNYCASVLHPGGLHPSLLPAADKRSCVGNYPNLYYSISSRPSGKEVESNHSGWISGGHLVECEHGFVGSVHWWWTGKWFWEEGSIKIYNYFSHLGVYKSSNKAKAVVCRSDTLPGIRESDGIDLM